MEMSSAANKTIEDIPIESKTLVIGNNVNPIFDPRLLGWTPFPPPATTATTTAYVSTQHVVPNGNSTMTGLDMLTTAGKAQLSANSSIFSSTSTGRNASVWSTFADQTTTKPPAIYDGSPYPIFCGPNTDAVCVHTPLSSCGACDMGGAALMATLVLLLGIAIVVGNSLILIVTAQRKKKRKIENMDLHRSSLAIADLLTGLQILIVFTFNFGSSFSRTSYENHTRYFEYRESTKAAVGGVLNFLTFTSSLYNLVYLAGQRLYAFVRPIQYKMQRKRTITLGLLATWLLAIVSSTVLVWFPQDFAPAYVPSTFLFFFDTKQTSSKAAPVILLFLFYLLPFLITIVLLTASAVIVYFHVRKSSKPVTPYSGHKDSDSSSSGETQYFVTVAFMQIGFAITIVPAFIVVLIDNFNPEVTYTQVAPVYAACFYVAMTNSLVNVVVYSIRDPKFRSNVADIFTSCCPTCFGDDVESLRVKSRRKQNLRTPSNSFAPASPNTTSEFYSKTTKKMSVSSSW